MEFEERGSGSIADWISTKFRDIDFGLRLRPCHWTWLESRRSQYHKSNLNLEASKGQKFTGCKQHHQLYRYWWRRIWRHSRGKLYQGKGEFHWARYHLLHCWGLNTRRDPKRDVLWGSRNFNLAWTITADCCRKQGKLLEKAAIVVTL